MENQSEQTRTTELGQAAQLAAGSTQQNSENSNPSSEEEVKVAEGADEGNEVEEGQNDLAAARAVSGPLAGQKKPAATPLRKSYGAARIKSGQLADEGHGNPTPKGVADARAAAESPVKRKIAERKQVEAVNDDQGGNTSTDAFTPQPRTDSDQDSHYGMRDGGSDKSRVELADKLQKATEENAQLLADNSPSGMQIITETRGLDGETLAQASAVGTGKNIPEVSHTPNPVSSASSPLKQDTTPASQITKKPSQSKPQVDASVSNPQSSIETPEGSSAKSGFPVFSVALAVVCLAALIAVAVATFGFGAIALAAAELALPILGAVALGSAGIAWHDWSATGSFPSSAESAMVDTDGDFRHPRVMNPLYAGHGAGQGHSPSGGVVNDGAGYNPR